jgi:hypothetical protein
MIQLPDVQPHQDVLDALSKYQAEINQEAGFEAQSEAAKSKFSSRNKKGNKIFDAVKESLIKMCSGARRCVYCEDSIGDEIEHIYPKSLYPGRVFDWTNYVYACGNCNGPKNDKFAIFRHDTGAYHEVNPLPRKPAIEPPPGDAVMINPRIENPLDYCMLDLGPTPKSTFKFVILKPENSDDYRRATYTFNDVLRLDERNFLRDARREAYGDYKARLLEYVHRRDAGASQVQLDKMIKQLQKKNHPTVWKEMQRYRSRNILKRVDVELDDLFSEAPEALAW